MNLYRRYAKTGSLSGRTVPNFVTDMDQEDVSSTQSLYYSRCFAIKAVVFFQIVEMGVRTVQYCNISVGNTDRRTVKIQVVRFNFERCIISSC